MKKYVFPSVVALMAATNAFAADLPRKAVPPIAPVVLPNFSWTGFYLGVNAGAGWSNDTAKARSLNTGYFDTVSLHEYGLDKVKYKNNGFVGGGQVGYNYQFVPGNSFVVGFETDLDYAGLKKGRHWTKPTVLTGPNGTWSQDADFQTKSGLDVLGTARARLGYAFDRVLVYGTGGLAYGTVNYRHSITLKNTLALNNALPAYSSEHYDISKSGTQTGYAYGGGIEYALPADSFLNLLRSNAVTLRAEYLHYDLGKRSLTQHDATGKVAIINTKVNSQGDVVRAGLNFKFGL